jgi:ABC-type Fe3+ transport system permease subunit
MLGMLTARELTLPLMLVTGRSSVITTSIFELQTNGETGPAAAVALSLIAALALLVFGTVAAENYIRKYR